MSYFWDAPGRDLGRVPEQNSRNGRDKKLNRCVSTGTSDETQLIFSMLPVLVIF